MLLNSSVLAVTLAANLVAPSTYECIPCRQATVYMPDVPVPKMTVSPEPFVREIALVPDDLPEGLSFPYSPPAWSEQLPISLDWLDELLSSPLRMPLEKKGPQAAGMYALEFELANKTALAYSKKQQTYAQNKIESLRPFDKTFKNGMDEQPIQSYLI